MSAIRRIYFYFVAFVSLMMLAWGAASLGEILIHNLIGDVVSRSRGDLTYNGALVLVGLPVWLLHWTPANQAARRDPAERTATLRRLYLYAVLAVLALGVLYTTAQLLEGLFRLALPEPGEPAARERLRRLPWIVVGGALWSYHRRVAAVDRRMAGEAGGSATLRRWYVYGIAFTGLVILLNSADDLLRVAWETVVETATASGSVVQGGTSGVARSAAWSLAGLAAWASHWSLWAVDGAGKARAARGPSAAAPMDAAGDGGG